MRNSSSIPGWRALASRYCCIIGVMSSCQLSVVGCQLSANKKSPRVATRGLGDFTDNRQLLTPVAARRGLADLGHRQAVAGGVVGDLGHVVAHQQEAPAAGAFQV